jgi:hypothetical protein
MSLIKKHLSLQKLVLILLFIHLHVQAQIENVYVEKYYLSDSIDATDSTGIPLPIGTKTYRIFVDLKQGCKIKKVYGDNFHPIEFKSTDTIWNNTDNGVSFGFEQNKNRLGDNTVALDSWLTIGQLSKNNPLPPFFGIPKNLDINGSIVGGLNNDGGSAGIAEGLITNTDSWHGISVTTADGIDTFSTTPNNWATYGLLNDITGDDSTMFGSLIKTTGFKSYYAGIQNSGTIGSDTTNHILIAQISTKGELTFNFNIEVEEPYSSGTRIVKYVSDNDTLLTDEIFSPYLKYPLVCGCTDFNYIEYEASNVCSDNSKCLTKIIFGCLDTNACNFDKNATYNISELCCYPGYCNDRNLNAICPSLVTKSFDYFIYPNPAENILNVEIKIAGEAAVSYSIFKSDGTVAINNTSYGNLNGFTSKEIDVSSLNAGIYLLLIKAGENELRKTFTKQ